MLVCLYMSAWYPVSIIGWFFTTLYSTLTAFIVHGLWVFDIDTPEFEFLNGAVYMYLILLLIFLFARFFKQKIFHAKK